MKPPVFEAGSKSPHRLSRPLISAFLFLYLMIQVLLPWRHLLYKGDVNWTREGHRFAWRLKSNVVGGVMSIIAVDPSTGQITPIIPFDDISPEQYVLMIYTPDMLLQYVHYLKEKLEKQGMKNPIIKVDGKISVNRRPFHPYIDRNVNLAEEKYRLFSSADWILPPPPDL